MNSLNSILLEGNLIKDAEVRNTPKGNPVATFTIASNRYFKKGDETQKEVSFFEVEAWGGLAQAGELTKGRAVRVVGRLKQDRWVDASGKNQTKVKIVADHIEWKPIGARQTLDEEPADE